MKYPLYIFFIFILLPINAVMSQSPEVLEAYQSMSFQSTDGHQLPYRVLWPKRYKKNKKSYPLILFLHGAGERGEDNQKQLVHGMDIFLNSKKNQQAVILAPQCATGDYWAQMVQDDQGQRYFNFDHRPNASLQAAMELLDQFLAEEAIDPDRVYVMGLSMGGMGTFELLARRPDVFAAAIPICGGTNPALLDLYADKVPMWIFHGDADKVVDVVHSRAVVSQLKQLGVKTKYTEYAGVGHNSWDPAFAEPELLNWLFAQRKN